MAKLIVGTGDNKGLEYDVRDGLVMGRGTSADIRLSDVKASREHAKLVAEGERFAVEDLESTNGTYVNGSRVKKHVLDHGDKIRIGMSVLVFHDPSSKKPSAAKPRIDLGKRRVDITARSLRPPRSSRSRRGRGRSRDRDRDKR